jgi:hypothetical protein
MQNEDTVSTLAIVGGSTISDEDSRLLTPEQRVFAEVIGREIARLWRDAHRDEPVVCVSGPQGGGHSDNL